MAASKTKTKWTSERPTEPGYYWCILSETSTPQVVRIFRSRIDLMRLRVMFMGLVCLVELDSDEFDGAKWSERLVAVYP